MYHPDIKINAQYLKDLSFENPKILETLSAPLEKAPGCSVEVEINARQAGDSMYEVTLQLHIDMRAEEKKDPLAILEISYAGVFTLPEIKDEEARKEAILVACPTILFPFVRAIVADITKESGVMPITLNPVDFKKLYEQRKSQVEAQTAAKH